MKPYRQSASTVCSRVRENNHSTDDPGTQCPTTTAASTRAPPITDASATRPGRMRYIHRPTNRAIGTVQAMVNVPHELPGTICLDPAGRVNVVSDSTRATDRHQSCRSSITPSAYSGNVSSRPTADTSDDSCL